VRRIADYVLDIEKQARTVAVEAAFINPANSPHLLPGYSADIEVILKVRDDVVRVPTEAVVDGNRVFVFHNTGGVLEQRTIRTGLSNWNWTEVVKGLDRDEAVVVNVDNPKLEDKAPAVLAEETP
jgi:HlyD family secretion protein